MKKHGRVIRLLAGFVAVALLAAAYAALRSAAAKEEAAGRDTLIALTADRIAGISWTLADETSFDFVREDGAWYRKDEADFPVSQTALNSLAAGVTGVGIYQTIEGVTDLTQYGLAEPAVTFTVTDVDGGTVTAAVGNANETAGSVYAFRTEDPATVYSVLVSLETNFDVTEADLRDGGQPASSGEKSDEE